MADIKYSQNFIRNKAVVKYLVKQAGIEKSDYVIEIGPGRGAITDILSEYADRVTAVEYDEKLYERLISEKQWENVEYVREDFLKYPLPAKESYKVFSNIPFQITADIMNKLTEVSNLPEEIFLFMQKEAAKKYCGIPEQKYEGLRASLLKAKYDVSIVHDFRRNDFYPVPKVDVVFVHFKKKRKGLGEEEFKEYKDLVSYFYTCLKGNTAEERLSALFSHEQVRRLAQDCRIALPASYTRITSAQWEKIFLYAKTGMAREKKARVKGAYHRLFQQQKRLKKQNRTSLRRNGRIC